MATNFAADFERNPEGLVYDTVFRVYLDPWLQSKAVELTDEIYHKAQEEREILRRHLDERAKGGDQVKGDEGFLQSTHPQTEKQPATKGAQTFVVRNKHSEEPNKMAKTYAPGGAALPGDGMPVVKMIGGPSAPAGPKITLTEGQSIPRSQISEKGDKPQRDTKLETKEGGGGKKGKTEAPALDENMKQRMEDEIRRSVAEEYQKRLEEEVQRAERNVMAHMEYRARENQAFFSRKLEKKDEDIRMLKDYNDRAKLEIDDLNSRVSKLSAEKLKSGNPNIGDLSDPFRPSELGRKFSEIYDNEWSDAFERLQKKKYGGDREIATLLYQLVTDSYKYCESVVELQCAYIRNLLISPYGYDKDEASKAFLQTLAHGDRQKKRHELIIALKDSRKKYAKETAKNVAKVYVKDTLPEKLAAEFKIPRDKIPEELTDYAEKCANISWFMVICDPPAVVVGGEVGAPFDEVAFKEFQTKTNKKEKFIVSRNIWPALRLGHNGALLEKGVAEAALKQQT